RPGEVIPHQALQAAGAVQRHQAVEELGVARALPQPNGLIVTGISRVEGDPQEDEAAVLVLAGLRAVKPAQGAMNTQRGVGGPAVAFLAVAGFEGGMGDGHGVDSFFNLFGYFYQTSDGCATEILSA